MNAAQRRAVYAIVGVGVGVAIVVGCLDRSPLRKNVPPVALTIVSNIETDTVGNRVATPRETFVVMVVQILNRRDEALPVELAFFKLEDDAGHRRLPAFAVAGDEHACTGVEVAAGGNSLTCNLIFTLRGGAAPLVLHYEHDGVTLEASLALASFSRCLAFADPDNDNDDDDDGIDDDIDDDIDDIDDNDDFECFELCSLSVCQEEHDSMTATCSTVCMELCKDGDDDPCTCAATECGTSCTRRAERVRRLRRALRRDVSRGVVLPRRNPPSTLDHR